MKEPFRLGRPLPRKKLARIDAIRRDFQVRAFGEELARVNLDMSEEQRRKYLNWMRETSKQRNREAPPARGE